MSLTNRLQSRTHRAAAVTVIVTRAEGGGCAGRRSNLVRLANTLSVDPSVSAKGLKA